MLPWKGRIPSASVAFPFLQKINTIWRGGLGHIAPWMFLFSLSSETRHISLWSLCTLAKPSKLHLAHCGYLFHSLDEKEKPLTQRASWKALEILLLFVPRLWSAHFLSAVYRRLRNWRNNTRSCKTLVDELFHRCHRGRVYTTADLHTFCRNVFQESELFPHIKDLHI